MTPLSPCPFCAGSAGLHIGLHSWTDAIVVCTECCAEGPMEDEPSDAPEVKAEKAIAAWNRRPAQPDTGAVAVIAGLLRARIQIGGTDWDKSSYGADMNAEEVASAILTALSRQAA